MMTSRQEKTQMVSIDQIKPNLRIDGDGSPEEVTHVVGMNNPDVARFLAQFEDEEEPTERFDLAVVSESLKSMEPHLAFGETAGATATFAQSEHPIWLLGLVLVTSTFWVLLLAA